MLTVKLAGAVRGVPAKDCTNLESLQTAILEKYELDGGDLYPEALEIAYIDEDGEQV
jgi:hypothetical protein